MSCCWDVKQPTTTVCDQQGIRKRTHYLASLRGNACHNTLLTSRIGNAIGQYEDLLTSVKRSKLKWNRHVTRSSGLVKTIPQGTVQGGRRTGRQRKRWKDNIKEWTGLEWNIILLKAENREEWRKLVVKSTVVPHRSARLRDRSDKKNLREGMSQYLASLRGTHVTIPC